MNILFDISHPAHVHLFRNTILELKKHHQVYITCRDVPVIIELLEHFRLPFKILGKKKKTMFGKIISVFTNDIRMFLYAHKNNIVTGVSSGMLLSHVSLVRRRMKTIILDDDDDSVEPLFARFAHPFANTVLTPDCIQRKTKRALYYNSIHELAYLHPRYFIPDPDVVPGNVRKNDYFVLRFVAFQGHHDIGQRGLSHEQKHRLIQTLLPFGRVLISSESQLHPDFEQYRIDLPPFHLHSLLAHAKMYIGDSQTMTTEAAVLGVPAVKCNTFSGKLSVPNELQDKYGLCYAFHPSHFEQFLDKINDLLKCDSLNEIWIRKRDQLFRDKINLTEFLVWLIQNYPESHKTIRNNPETLKQFHYA